MMTKHFFWMNYPFNAAHTSLKKESAVYRQSCAIYAQNCEMCNLSVYQRRGILNCNLTAYCKPRQELSNIRSALQKKKSHP